DDTPLVARSARLAGERVLLGLSDGTEEVLDPATLTVDEAGVLRAWARGGKLEARLARSAAAVVSERITDDAGRPGHLARVGVAIQMVLAVHDEVSPPAGGLWCSEGFASLLRDRLVEVQQDSRDGRPGGE